jgi:hypothetical protein
MSHDRFHRTRMEKSAINVGDGGSATVSLRPDAPAAGGPDPPRTGVFVSYRREDTAHAAVRRELELALSGGVTILPVLVDDARISRIGRRSTDAGGDARPPRRPRRDETRSPIPVPGRHELSRVAGAAVPFVQVRARSGPSCPARNPRSDPRTG